MHRCSTAGISPPPFLAAAPREDDVLSSAIPILLSPTLPSPSFTHVIIIGRESSLPRDHVKRARGRRETKHSISLTFPYLLFSSPTTPLIHSLFTRLTPCCPSSSSSFLPPLFPSLHCPFPFPRSSQRTRIVA